MVKRGKLADILHIKRNTEGTSNEISFSVLDARKERKRRSHYKPKRQNVSYNGVFRPPPLSGVRPYDFNFSRETSKDNKRKPAHQKTSVSRETTRTPLEAQQEIARRKARRRSRRLVSGVLGTLLIVLVVGSGGYFLYQDHLAQESYRSMLLHAVSLVSETDNTILTLDDVLKQPKNDETLVVMEDVQKNMPTEKEKLELAGSKASELLDRFRNARDREAAGQVMNAASSRQVMLEEGSHIIDETEDAYHAAKEIEEAWSLVLSADALAREAATLVSDTTADNVARSNELISSAQEQLAEASVAFSGLTLDQSVFDPQPYIDYIAKRTESLGYALLSNDAIVLQDKATAEENNRLYNEKDAEAASMAETLEDDPAKALYQNYDDTTETLFRSYNDARAKASSADSFLRDYLGEVAN